MKLPFLELFSDLERRHLNTEYPKGCRCATCLRLESMEKREFVEERLREQARGVY
jgi:hypothetical protein